MRKKATRGCGSLIKETMCYKTAGVTAGDANANVNVDCCVRKASDRSDKVCRQWADSKEGAVLW